MAELLGAEAVSFEDNSPGSWSESIVVGQILF